MGWILLAVAVVAALSLAFVWWEFNHAPADAELWGQDPFWTVD